MNLRSRLESLRPALAAAAQAVVDEWDQGDDGVDEMFGEGGACDAVAQAMAGVLGSIDTIEGGQPGDDHAYLIAFDDTDAFAVDIPPGVYETGGGSRWRKRQGAQISEGDVVIDPVNRSDIETEMEENPRKRAAGLTEGTDDANRRREGSGRFLKSTPCDFCGKSCAAEHFTDDRACGGGDGPGFYLCGKATCERAREKLERTQGFEALKQHYVDQRRKNDAVDRGKTKAFLDGPRGTEIQLANLRRQQDIVARKLSYTTEDYKVKMLQDKERELQRQVDKLVFGDEQVPNASGLAKTHLLVLGGHRPSCNRMGRLAAGFQAVKLNEFIRLPPEERCERCEPLAQVRLERALEAQRAKKTHTPNHAAGHYNLTQLDDDIDAALDHMSDFDVHLNKSNISVTDPMMIPMRQLGEYDDLSSWLDLDSGSDERDVKDFRGARWAALAAQWTGPQQMPPIVIVEAPSAVAIADGRGRVNYATAMGWDEIPAVIVTPAHEPNHAAVHYVWLIDYRGVPMDTEGPYGPMSLDRASAYARIGAKEGDHDRVVSTGREIMSDGFEIVRRYRRGTGERIL